MIPVVAKLFHDENMPRVGIGPTVQKILFPLNLAINVYSALPEEENRLWQT
jgi:hypothetical protein